MNPLEDIFSSKKQRELLKKYEETCYRNLQELMDTLPIKEGVWFKYGEQRGVIRYVILYRDLEKMDIRFNPKGLEYKKDDRWLTIKSSKDYDKIQIIPENECSNRYPDSDSHIE